MAEAEGDFSHYYALIMAGGVGSRLWPLSRQRRPKQALSLVSERTMFQLAVDRLKPLFPSERIMVVTAQDHAPVLREQVPELPPENFILEPVGRGTAPAVGLAALHLSRRDPEAVMAVLTADHYIHDTARFRAILAAAYQVALEGHLVTLGITPSYAATGFGYIQQGAFLGEYGGFRVYRVESFVEKPDQATAEGFLKSGRTSWNSGMFIWRVDRILQEFEIQMPQFYQQLQQVGAALDGPHAQEVLARVWPRVASQTIDYGIMEGAKDVAVIPADIGWNDVGSWAALLDILSEDEAGNVIRGRYIGIDTRDTLIFGTDRLVATIGLRHMIVVDTEDAVLVCPVDRAQDVKKLVDKLQELGEGYL